MIYNLEQKFFNSILGDQAEISPLKKMYSIFKFEYSSEALDQKVFLRID